MATKKGCLIAGILNDSCKDENGKEFRYTLKIVGTWEGEEPDKVFKAASFSDNKYEGSIDLSVEEFRAKVTNVCKVLED